jgi:ATP-dependent helicase/nuclease subunit B
MTTTASTAAPFRREYLGWDRPALVEAARRIAEKYGDGQNLDLGPVIIVVPGQRAGRRLQELLAFHAEDKTLRFTPPRIVTEGQLAELLYTPKLPFAGDLVQDLAWAQALLDLAPENLRHVVPRPPGAEDALRWLELGKVLRGLHVELAADGLDFAAVRKSGPNLPDFTEADRWDALVAVQERYHRILDAQELWDKQTARLTAVKLREITTDCDVILLGTVDLNNSLRMMLEQVAERVTVYLVAPEKVADHFDGHGCLIPEKWRDAEIPLRDEQLRQVEGPEEQADAVSAWLAELGGRLRVDEVAIGVPDEALVPQLQRQLDQANVKARWVEGVRLGETAPYRLLAVAVRYAGAERYDDLAALLRHPDLEDWLDGAPPRRKPIRAANGTIVAASMPAQLDRYYNRRLPSRIRCSEISKKDWPDLAGAVERIEGWLKEATDHHPLRQWGGVFCKILDTVYGSRTLHLEEHADAALHETMRKIVEACEQSGSIPEALDTASLTAADAFQVALGPLAEEYLPPPADADAVEILGWLELPLDDSKALIVTSFNEGFVPKSAGADAFLPDRHRRELGLLHNERRYARDAYATSVLCQSRENLRVVFARRDVEKNPLHPSRLLFACSDETLIRRARRYFAGNKGPAAPRRLLLAAKDPIPEKSPFRPPAPAAAKRTLERISVTRFKAYLACPYRYYLQHARKLKVVNDAARELDGGAFGTLLHKALGAFGRDPSGPRNSERKRDIGDFLNERLSALAREVFGRDQRRPAIRLQLEQARLRLDAFAARQAELVQEGWRIIYVEDDADDEEDRNQLITPFPAKETLVELTGRIDRIDLHEGRGVLRVLDYKTADNAEKPDKTHRKKDAWIDLQLPLYRHLVRAAALDRESAEPIELGYLNLPKKPAETGVSLATWDKETLEDADKTAVAVICNLRKECDKAFWPPKVPAPKYSDDFAAICLDRVMSGPGLEDEDEGGSE